MVRVLCRENVIGNIRLDIGCVVLPRDRGLHAVDRGNRKARRHLPARICVALHLAFSALPSPCRVPVNTAVRAAVQVCALGPGRRPALAPEIVVELVSITGPRRRLAAK